MDDKTEYSDDPVAVAERWVAAGARRLHIVDLDGARTGKPIHAKLIHEIAEKFPDLPIQVGGGIRNEDTVQRYLEAGVSYVIIGTKAVTAPHFVADVCLEFPGHIIVGLDVRDGRVAIDGWSKMSRHNAIELAEQFEQDGVAAIVYTDISKDGLMQGVNVAATVELAQALAIPVIASGGISTLDDVRALCEVTDEGIEAAITGRAIYEGTIDFTEAQTLADDLANADARGSSGPAGSGDSEAD